jgi:hypothetical protein
MEKVDYKKQYKLLYNPTHKEVTKVDVPILNYIMMDGEGNPNNSLQFEGAVQALYSTAYTLKFMLKKQNDGSFPDFAVMPLEGLWWSDNMDAFVMEKKDDWKWTLMILQPDFVTEDLIKKAIEEANKKKPQSMLSQVRLERLEEGLCAQIMYFGPYAEEGPTIQKLHQYVKENGYTLIGKHHEIYLSDPRRCAPEKMKTIIRQPMR